MRLHLAVGRCAETNNDMAVLQLTRDWAGDAVRSDTRNSQSMACTNALGAHTEPQRDGGSAAAS
jgi:hypothetical protein